ncbi:MAG: DUF6273 domain-containing protein [Lachnospiraceae bacterium]|nr:DUF6273 domain-containing protein [Lachnospiraceae bacterium]
MYCIKCGVKNDDDAKFCIACGEQIDASPVRQDYSLAENGVTTKPAAAKTKKDKLPFIIVGAVLLIGIITFAIFFVINASPEAKARKELKLANQYLDEMQYEMAIASYNKAIEINPKNVEAYEGLANTYVAMAEKAYADGYNNLAIEYYKKANDVLDLGEKETEDEKLEVLRQDIEDKKIGSEEIAVEDNRENVAVTEEKHDVEDASEDVLKSILQAKVGDIVTYGNYGITNRIYNHQRVAYAEYEEKVLVTEVARTSEPVTPIEWIVLANDENGVILLSKYILDIIPYNYEYDSAAYKDNVIWENSDVRKWLNKDFYNTAFTEEEKKFIKTTTCKGLEFEGDDYIAEEWNMLKDTVDKVYLLSAGEVERYFGVQQSEQLFYDWWEGGLLEYEEYEVYCNEASGGRLSAYSPARGENHWWWLRLPNYYFCELIEVTRNGGIDYIGSDDYYDNYYYNGVGAGGVRPVIRIGL